MKKNYHIFWGTFFDVMEKQRCGKSNIMEKAMLVVVKGVVEGRWVWSWSR